MAEGVATKIAKIGWNYNQGARWPFDPGNGILRWSNDGGRTWGHESIPPAWRFQVTYNGKTYLRGAGGEGSLVRATNGWLVAALRTDMPPRYYDVLGSKPGGVAGLYDDNLEGMGVSISRDDGVTWSPVNLMCSTMRAGIILTCCAWPMATLS
jgi:hypothetical protein